MAKPSLSAASCDQPMWSGKCSAKATAATLRIIDPTSGGSARLLLGASAATYQMRHVCPERAGHAAAWPSSMYESFAHALGWETNNAISGRRLRQGHKHCVHY